MEINLKGTDITLSNVHVHGGQPATRYDPECPPEIWFDIDTGCEKFNEFLYENHFDEIEELAFDSYVKQTEIDNAEDKISEFEEKASRYNDF